MPSPQVLNTNANLDGKTLLAAENADTITGLKTFDRDPSAPFAVTASSAVVPNLDADKVDGLDATDLMLLDGTQAMTGALNLGTPGQIQFPATQNPSADANCLDDYEEGTFTPTRSFGGAAVGITYSVQSGVYTKVGRLIVADIRVALTSKGSSTGAAVISGLPFTGAGTAVGSPIDFAVAGAGLTSPFTLLSGATVVLAQNSATVRGNLTDANFTNTSDIRFTLAFRPA